MDLKKGLKVCLVAVIAGMLVGAPAVAGTELDATANARLRFESVTLSDAQFLMGAKEGQAVEIWGDLHLPTTGEARFPAVILVHGSGGVSTHEERWADELMGIGVAAFILDSFSGRGIDETASVKALLSSVFKLGR